MYLRPNYLKMLLGHLKFCLKSNMAAKNPIWPPKCIKSYFSELNFSIFEFFSTDYDVRVRAQLGRQPHFEVKNSISRHKTHINV